MTKTYVLDTSVILTNPFSIYNFEDNIVYIPMAVIEELDKMKNRNDDVGRNARLFSRKIEDNLEQNNSNIIIGTNTIKNLSPLQDSSDNKIIMITKQLDNANSKAILVTNDINMRLKAKALGVKAEPYRNNFVKNTIRPIDTIFVNGDIIDTIYSNKEGCIFADDIMNNCYITYEGVSKDKIFLNNKYFIFKSDDEQKSCICRYFFKNGKGVFARIDKQEDIFGITPRNAEQTCLMDALLDVNVDLVICNGVAGSGKTLLAIAAGLYAQERKKYRKILVYKVILPFGNDIGYLKGDKEDKLKPHLQPYFDNLELIFDGKTTRYQYLLENGVIEIDALTYIRGRSIPHRYIIVDELQNLSPAQAKTIVSRIGDNSKLVLLGDVKQIDNPNLNENNNALTYIMEKMSHLDNVVAFNLVKSERSVLAQQAIDLL